MSAYHVEVAADKGHGLVGLPGVLDDQVAAARRKLHPLHLHTIYHQSNDSHYIYMSKQKNSWK